MGLFDRIREIEDRSFDWLASDRDRQRKLHLITCIGFLVVACGWVVIGVIDGSRVGFVLGAASAITAGFAARNWKQLRDDQRSTRS